MKAITDHPFSQALFSSPDYFWNCRTKEQLEKYHSTPRENCDHEALLAITQENRKLFRLIASFVPTCPGWASTEKSCALAGLVLAMKPLLVVEIGLFAGRSALPMAMAMQCLGNGKLVGIDPYSKEASAEDEVPENAVYWSGVDHESILNQFQHFVKSFALDNFVHLIRQKSDEVLPPKDIDILHIDGNHSAAAVRDAERYGQNVRLGGIVIADDTRWVQGSVLRAIDTLVEDMGFRECYTIRKHSAEESDDWMVLQKFK